MRCDLGLSKASVALYVFKLVASIEVILHRDVTVKEIVQPESSWTGLGQPQLKMSTVQLCTPGQACTTCVRTQVGVVATAGFQLSPAGRLLHQKTILKKLTINYLEVSTNTNIRITVKRSNSAPNALKWCEMYKNQCRNIYLKYSPHEDRSQNFTQMTVWELTYDCFEISQGGHVHVAATAYYKGFRNETSDWYTAEEIMTVPRFDVSVDGLSRSLTISVATGPDVHTRLCYRKHTLCSQLPSPVHVTINTTNSLTANLSFPYLLPCLCVQVYYLHTDAERATYCPFENKPLDAGGRDVWLSSSVKLYGDQSLVLEYVCPDASLIPFASLCWQVQRNSSSCIPIANSTLQREGWKYSVSAVEKHPQMCVQFKLNSSYNVHCPFQSGVPAWQAVVLPAVWQFRVRLSSGTPAAFSAQLCVLEGEMCVARGDVQSVMMKNGSTKAELSLPVTPPYAGLCVQVWRSAPFLRGRRLLCPEYSHRRLGLIVIAALIVAVFMIILVNLAHQRIQRGLSDWQLSQKPVLLVCSSEQTQQVSAVCALASLLQGELCAGVRMALWAKNTGGVAKLGPLPWLYGQCEAVRDAGGRVLIAWSPEAKDAYQSWRKGGEEEEGSEGEKPHREKRGVDKKDEKDRLGQEMRKDSGGKHNSQAWKYEQREPSSVTAPVLRAALACLQGELQGGREGHGFALVYFEGLSHSQDIPQELRGVPRYCLPQDFRGLVQELQGGAAGVGKGRGSKCWAGLLSKILAQRLAQKLKTWLPQTWAQEEEVQRIAVKLSWKPEREDKQYRLTGLPLLFREGTNQSENWEDSRLTMSIKGPT